MPRGTVDATIKVKGLKELTRDLKKAENDTDKQLREGLKKAAEPVQIEWMRTFRTVHEFSASKLKTRVSQKGAFVLQSLRKTTGDHPEFATLQLKYGEAALDAKSGEVYRELEHEIDDLADTVEGKI